MIKILYRRVHAGWFIAASVAIVYLPLSFFLLNFPAIFPIYGDGQYYVALADNLLHHGVFSGSVQAPFQPATFIMPAYPFLLAAFKMVFFSYNFFPLIQMVLVGVTALLIYKIGRQVFSDGAGLVAAFLFILDPTTILHAMIIMTDVTYVFLIVLAVYLLFFSGGGEKKQSAATFFSGLLFGFAMLTRVISVFLPILVLPLYFLVQRKRMATRKILIHLLILSVAYGAVVLPWMFRNQAVSGVWGIAGEKSLNLFQYYVPEFLSFKRGISADEGRRILMADLTRQVGPVSPKDISSLTYAPFEEKVALSYVKRDVFGYGLFHLMKTAPFFLASGLKDFISYYNNAVGYRAYGANTGNMTNLIFRGRFREFFAELRVQPLVTVEELFWFGLSLLMIIGLVFSKGRTRLYGFLFAALILYFALLTGPMAYSRFRLPAAPFIFLLASFGASVVYKTARNFFNQEKVA